MQHDLNGLWNDQKTATNGAYDWLGLEGIYGDSDANEVAAILAVAAAANTVTDYTGVKGIGKSEINRVLGGAHKDTSKPTNDGMDSHHCPAKNCYKGSRISSADGTAIKMDPADHQRTESSGSSASALAYRSRQQALLQQGKLMDAIQMDIDDIRSKFGNKYDPAIEEMLEYARTLNPEDFRR